MAYGNFQTIKNTQVGISDKPFTRTYISSATNNTHYFTLATESVAYTGSIVFTATASTEINSIELYVPKHKTLITGASYSYSSTYPYPIDGRTKFYYDDSTINVELYYPVTGTFSGNATESYQRFSYKLKSGEIVEYKRTPIVLQANESVYVKAYFENSGMLYPRVGSETNNALSTGSFTASRLDGSDVIKFSSSLYVNSTGSGFLYDYNKLNINIVGRVEG